MGEDRRRGTEQLVLARSFFDFIDVELYTNPNRYSVRVGMKYWIWSELKEELQEYKVTEGLRYDLIEPYINKELCYREKFAGLQEKI